MKLKALWKNLPFSSKNIMGTLGRNKSCKPGKEDLDPGIVAKDGGGRQDDYESDSCEGIDRSLKGRFVL